MVAVIATFTVAEGEVEAFETVARALIGEVRANEPGVTLYRLTRAKENPHVFKSMELYATKEDLKAHGNTAYFRAAFSAMKPLLAAEPVIEVLDEVA